MKLRVTLAFTGARPNELSALRWDDVDFEGGIISITKGRVRGVEGSPRTLWSEREIPMLDIVAQTLRHLYLERAPQGNDYVFVGRKGAPINKHLDVVWGKAVREFGIRHRPA